MDDATTDLSGEDLTHRVLELLTPVLVDIQIVDYFQSVAPKLSVENPVCDLDGGQDGHDVEGFPEGVFQVVQVVLLVISDKIYGDIGIFDNLESFSSSPSSSSFFLFSAPISTSIVFVVVTSTTSTSSLSFPPVIVALTSSVVLGTNEQLWPGLLSSDNVPEEVGLEEFLPKTRKCVEVW